MRWSNTLWRWTEVALWWAFGRPTSEMRKRWQEEDDADPRVPKPGKTYI